ncbi:hypothetical protein [Mycobacterium sp. 4858]|uniref:hypothetical protein n=1 Tax=Mycobacterium sp. 4858 TaxID=2057185 RepID=UPI001304FC94|nr:hypothetical protein [Mycobacterium sp. 4858]
MAEVYVVMAGPRTDFEKCARRLFGASAMGRAESIEFNAPEQRTASIAAIGEIRRW